MPMTKYFKIIYAIQSPGEENVYGTLYYFTNNNYDPDEVKNQIIKKHPERNKENIFIMKLDKISIFDYIIATKKPS